MAESHPSLLKWFASKSPGFALLKITPLIIFLLYTLFQESPFIVTKSKFFIIGVFFWSFFEYAIHRWLYHKTFSFRLFQWFFDTFHLHHHKNLQDYRVLNAGILLVYPLCLLFTGGFYLLSGDYIATVYFTLGALVYYIFYVFVHYLIHYKKYSYSYLATFQSYHLYHHYKRWNRNYGNTTTLWDRIFGTYDKEYKNFQWTESIKEDLITKK